MLKFMREKGKSWALRGVLLIVALTFVLWGGSSILRGPGAGLGGRVVALVEGLPITAAEVEGVYRQRLEGLRRQLGEAFSEELASRLNLRGRALEELIAGRLELWAARELGFVVSDAELSAAIWSIPAFQRGGRFDLDQYHRVLELNRIRPADFEAQQRRILLVQKLRDYLAVGIWVSEGELREAHRRLTEKVRVSYVRFRSGEFQKGLSFSPKEVAQYFEKHKEEFRTPPRRKVAYLFLDREKLAAAAKVSEKALRSYYEVHRAEYATTEVVRGRHILLKLPPDAPPEKARAVEKRARELLEKLRAGADFAAIAREHSEGPEREKGGDLGRVSRGEFDPAFERALFSLKRGEVGGPVRTPYGYHLLKVEEKTPAGTKPFEEVRPQLEAGLRAQKARDREREEALELRIAWREGRDPGARKEAWLQSGTTGFFPEGSPPAGFPEPALLARAAFSVGKKGGISRALGGLRGTVIVKLLEVRPSALPKLDAVRAKVEGRLREVRAEELARKRARAWRERLQRGERLESLAGVEKRAVERAAPFTRGAPPRELARELDLIRRAFRARPGESFVEEVAGGALLVRVEGFAPPEEKSFAEKKEELRRLLLQRKQDLFFAQFIGKLRERARVVVKEDYLAYNPPAPRAANPCAAR
ncbi:MAG: SurA N-terminal domain-containing protein [Nitrospinota bacterium]